MIAFDASGHLAKETSRRRCGRLSMEQAIPAVMGIARVRGDL
jgi:hypothetical protein